MAIHHHEDTIACLILASLLSSTMGSGLSEKHILQRFSLRGAKVRNRNNQVGKRA